MKYLVTGGNGFLGREICRYLSDSGHNVVSVDILKSESKSVYPHLQCDITDRGAMQNAMSGVNRVIHTAAVVPMRKAGINYHRVNAGGTGVVLEAAIRAGVKHFTYVSSSAVYGTDGEDKGLATPTVEPLPAEEYGRSKLEGEKICRNRESEIKIAILRPRTILGPGRLGIFSVLFDRIRSSKNIYVLGSGNQMLQLISLSDAVQLTASCSSSELTGIYNLGGPDPVSMRKTLETLCEYAKSGTQVRSVPAVPVKLALGALDKLRLSPFAPWHYKTLDCSMSLNISLTNRVLGECRHSSVQSLLESYKWYLSNSTSAKSSNDTFTHREPAKSGIFKIF